MINIDEARLQAFEALSALSDAQEFLTTRTGREGQASLKINHAKRHLLVIIQSGTPQEASKLFSDFLMKPCSLEEDKKEGL